MSSAPLRRASPPPHAPRPHPALCSDVEHASAGGGPAVARQGLSSALLSRVPSQQVARQMSKHITFGAARYLGAADADGATPATAAAAAAAGDLESGQGAGEAADDSPKPGDSEEGGGGGGPSLADMRLRILHGMKRHFRSQRMAGLLSPDGLRVARCVRWACGRAALPSMCHPFRREGGGLQVEVMRGHACRCCCFAPCTSRLTPQHPIWLQLCVRQGD